MHISQEPPPCPFLLPGCLQVQQLKNWLTDLGMEAEVFELQDVKKAKKEEFVALAKKVLDARGC